MDYVTRWIWYNSDDGENEDDYSVEFISKLTFNYVVKIKQLQKTK